MYKILAEQKKKNQNEAKEFFTKNLKSVFDNLLRDKLKKISNEVERLGEMYDVKIKNLTNRINYQNKKLENTKELRQERDASLEKIQNDNHLKRISSTNNKYSKKHYLKTTVKPKNNINPNRIIRSVSEENIHQSKEFIGNDLSPISRKNINETPLYDNKD